VGRQTGLKHTPSISFTRDTVPDTAQTIEDLVSRAKAEDERVAAARVGAEPAGDPDPYRKPAVLDEDGPYTGDDHDNDA
jgi:ribosome-binding factor A